MFYQSTTSRTVGIWGGGLVGLSTAAYFARKGIKSLIYDIDSTQVSRINDGDFHPDFEDWIGFSITGFTESGSIRATREISDLVEASLKVHFVAVPTERHGEPYMDAIKSVLEQIVHLSPDLCIIESTVTPGMTERLGRETSLPLGIATRRDWFTAGDNNLENCARVYAGVNEEVSNKMQAILSMVCQRLIRATSCTVVELTKCLDNGMFHTMAIYASQIALAYSDVNVTEALELAATHWRLGNHVYFPSIGTGGPCVPLANKYLLSGARHPRRLTLADGALRYEIENPVHVASLAKKQLKPGESIAILGICYRGDIRVHAQSSHLKFARELVRLGVSVGVHDPYFSNTEIAQLTGGFAFEFPDDLKKFQLVYVGPNHNTYTETASSVLAYMQHGQQILDNQGTWKNLADEAHKFGITYHRVGGAGWLQQDIKDLNDEEGPIVIDTRWLRVRTIPNKNPLLDPWYVVDRADSVTIIATSSSGRLLLQKQYRVPINDSSWEFPMGCIDRGEQPQQAAQRELSEETGLQVEVMKFLGCYRPIPGLSAQKTHVFLAHVTDEQLDEPRAGVEEEGISGFRVVNIPIFSGLVRSGEIVDGFTLGAFGMWQSSEIVL